MQYEEFEEEQAKSENLSITQRLDGLKLSKWHKFIIICLGMTWIFDGYEVSMLGLASSDLQKEFDIGSLEIGYIASSYLIGCCVGALLFGYLASKYGRKSLFSITLLIYLLSVIIQSFISHYIPLLICRVFTGIAVGGEYTAIFAAIDELIPIKDRGKVDIIIDGTWYIGTILASVASVILYTHYKETGIWRVLFLIGGIASIPFVFLRKKIPESPRWLLNKGRQIDANFIVIDIEYCVENNIMFIPDNMKKNYQEINENNPNILTEINYQNKNFQFTPNIFHILKKLITVYKRRLLLGMTLMGAQSFFFNGIFYTYTMILKEFYDINNDQAGYFMIPLSISSLAGNIILGRYFDTLGRRKMFLITYGISSFLLTLTAILLYFNMLNLVSQCIFWILIFFIATPGASSAHLTISEIFPSHMRSQALGIFFCIGVGVSGAIAPTFFGYLISEKNRSSISYGYFTSAFLMFSAGIIGFFFGIDAERKSLEEIAKLN